MAPLRVVVADDHHHVLPEIHLAIRKRALPFTGIHVLHFDAHPDLSFPRTLDPALVFEPQALYDALDDSVSGIAEFLLPLVYAGHVNRITWVKPHWAKQMPVQAMPLASVGKHSDTNALCVSLPLAHFIDEDAFAPASVMDAATRKEWELIVTVLSSSATNDASTRCTGALQDNALLARGEALVLDIDLDYFSTWNPFRKDLEQRLGASAADTVARVFQSVRYKDMTNDMDVSARVCDRRAFAAAMEQLRTGSELLDTSGTAWDAMLTSTLLPLYVRRRYSRYNESESDEREIHKLLVAFVDMLAALDADARELVWWAGPNMELPHHESSEDEIRDMVSALREFLTTSASTKRPALVTIAKSTGDEYLPPHQLAFVQTLVLEALEDVYGDLAIEFVEYEDTPDIPT